MTPPEIIKKYTPYKIKYYYRTYTQSRRIKHEIKCNYLFIHINKTGGTSIENALKLPFRHATALELVDYFGEAEFKKRFTFAFVRNPWSRAVSEYNFRVKSNQNNMGINKIPFESWLEKIYIERDPYYLAGLMKRDKNNKSGTKYEPKMFQPQSSWICDGSGNLLVNFVGKFEYITTDFEQICQEIGVKVNLPHLNSTQSQSWKDYYKDTKSVDIISSAFAEDIERFGYEF